jgi:myosin-1
VRAPPPPPPAAAPAPKKPTAKALYDFNSQQSNELSIKAGEIVQIVSKEGNGKHGSPFASYPSTNEW